MTGWITIPNPSWTDGQEPRIVKATCHDGSNLLTIRCPWCSRVGHVHESQAGAEMPPEVTVEIRCHMCGNVSETEMRSLQAAFAQMRAEGWIE